MIKVGGGGFFIFLGCKQRNVDCLNFEIYNKSEGFVI